MIIINEPGSTFHGRQGAIDHILTHPQGDRTIFVRLRGEEEVALPFADSVVQPDPSGDPSQLVELVVVSGGPTYDPASWKAVTVRRRAGEAIDRAMVQDALETQRGLQVQRAYLGFHVGFSQGWRWEVID